MVQERDTAADFSFNRQMFDCKIARDGFERGRHKVCQRIYVRENPNSKNWNVSIHLDASAEVDCPICCQQPSQHSIHFSDMQNLDGPVYSGQGFFTIPF